MNTEKESKNSRTRRMTAYPYKVFAGHNTSGQIPKGKQGSPLDISFRAFGSDVIGLPDRQGYDGERGILAGARGELTTIRNE